MSLFADFIANLLWVTKAGQPKDFLPIPVGRLYGNTLCLSLTTKLLQIIITAEFKEYILSTCTVELRGHSVHKAVCLRFMQLAAVYFVLSPLASTCLNGPKKSFLVFKLSGMIASTSLLSLGRQLSTVRVQQQQLFKMSTTAAAALSLAGNVQRICTYQPHV